MIYTSTVNKLLMAYAKKKPLSCEVCLMDSKVFADDSENPEEGHYAAGDKLFCPTGLGWGKNVEDFKEIVLVFPNNDESKKLVDELEALEYFVPDEEDEECLASDDDEED